LNLRGAAPLSWLLILLLLAVVEGCTLRAASPFRTNDTRTSPVFAARYRGWIAAGEKKTSIRAIVYALPPDRLRVEILSPLGRPRVSLICRGERAWVLIPPERVFWQGSSRRERLDWLGLPEGADLWIAAMSADHGMLGRILQTPASVSEDGAHSYRKRYEAGGSIRLEFAGQRAEPALVAEATIVRDGREAILYIERQSLLDSIDRDSPFLIEVPEEFSELRDMDLLGMLSEENPC
jgi:hypothetical protein